MSRTLAAVWHKTVTDDPAAIALVTAVDGRVWRRRELAAAAAEWGARGAGPMDQKRRRIALCLPNGFSWWEAFIGLLMLDAVPVVIDASEPPARRLEIARSARAVGLWSEAGWTPVQRSARRVAPEVCLVKLTSGSTGTPRAWPFTHAQMIADGRQVCRSMGIGPRDLNLAAIPLGHSYGLGNLVIPLLTQGTAVVMVDSPLPHVLAAAATRWRPTVFPAVPTLLEALLRSSVEPAALASLRLVISAGAALPAALAQDFLTRLGRTVHNFYGSSETGGICYDRAGAATLEGRSVGRPLHGVRLRWRTGGRFQVSSPAVGGRGVFSPLDLGQLNKKGELVLLGRSGRVVKIGARRVDLGEIEVALKSLPGVSDAYAAASNAARPAVVVAVASARDKADLRAAIGGKLPTWKLPQKFVVLPALPRTPRGKLDRAALDALLLGAAGAGAST